MTLQDLSNIYDYSGLTAAVVAIEEAALTREEKDDLIEELGRLQEEKLRRWTHPSRYPAVFDRHEF